MYIKIYFGDRPLFLCDAIDTTVQPYIHHDDALFIDELNAHTIKTVIHEMQQPSVHAAVFFHPDLEKLRKAFFKKFTLIKAAGGLILNEQHAVLLIFRRGKWDLPKGKLEKNESLRDCAIREAEEETGLKNIRLLKDLVITYHTYHEGTHFILKESHWFLMAVQGEQILVPQREEDIHELRWVKTDDLESYRSNSFPSINDVLDLSRGDLTPSAG